MEIDTWIGLGRSPEPRSEFKGHNNKKRNILLLPDYGLSDSKLFSRWHAAKLRVTYTF
jgi:hypothetical protein